MKKLLFISLLIIFGLMVPQAKIFAAEETSAKACHSQCAQCEKVCRETLKSLKKDADPELRKALQDCIDTCQQSQVFSKRDSKLQMEVMALCAKACDLCAQACEKAGLPSLKDCIQTCKDCKAACEKMTGS